MTTETKMELEALAHETADLLKRRGLMLATAESCTGGGVAQALTAIPGSSAWFERGFIAYSNLAKREMLGVKTQILARSGAVSENTARAMAEGALAHSVAQVALAVTGVAGPGGGTPEKPVGTVCLAWAGKKRETRTAKYYFQGEREAVRQQSIIQVLRGLINYLSS